MKTKTDWKNVYVDTLMIGTLAVIGAASANIISWWWVPAPIVFGVVLFWIVDCTWYYLGFRWAVYKAQRRLNAMAKSRRNP